MKYKQHEGKPIKSQKKKRNKKEEKNYNARQIVTRKYVSFMMLRRLLFFFSQLISLESALCSTCFLLLISACALF